MVKIGGRGIRSKWLNIVHRVKKGSGHGLPRSEPARAPCIKISLHGSRPAMAQPGKKSWDKFGVFATTGLKCLRHQHAMEGQYIRDKVRPPHGS
jgi:hypothetical protein